MPATLKRGAASDADSTSNTKADVQPLRDLARNFDIDIEPYLEEYLRLTEELEAGEEGGGGLDGEGGEGVTAQQFAAAALKIQNSVGIYNRKVDFLHQVAYAVLHDFVHSHLSRSKKKRPSNRGGDPEIEAFDDYDPDLEFLPLDDVLPTDRTEGRRRINLREEERLGSDMNATHLHLDQTLATTAPGINNNASTPEVTMISLGGVLSASRTMDQNGTFVVNRASLDAASPRAMARMLLANLQGGRGTGPGGHGNHGEGNLRLVAGRCDVGSNGALLMPGTRASVFVNGERTGRDEEEVQIFPGGLSPGPAHKENTNDFDGLDDTASFGNHGGGDDWGGDDDGGVGFELNDEPMDVGPVNGIDGEEKKDEAAMDAANAMHQTKPRPKPKTVVEDPWAVLDPHEPSKEKPKPLRIGVTYRLPPELDEEDRPSAAVTGSSTRTKKSKKKNGDNHAAGQEKHDFFSPPFICLDMLDGLMQGDDEEKDMDESDESIAPAPKPKRHLMLLEKLRRNELIFGDEFAHIAKEHAKHMKAIRRQRRLREEQGDEEVAEPATMNPTNDFDDDEEDYGGGFDFGGGDDYSAGDHDAHNQNGENGPLHRSNVDFDAIDDVFGGGGGGGFDDNNYNDDDGFAHGAQLTFEELCKAHLRKFARSAEAYAAETNLTRRVGAWQEGLAPLLEEQEGRPEFDIHSCGRKILKTVERQLTVRKRTSTGDKKLDSSSLGSTGNVVSFSTIFSNDCEDYEVCRLFLSTLMLCNCGNIDMHAGGEGEVVESADSLGLQLLDSEFQPPMEMFVAPSLDE